MPKTKEEQAEDMAVIKSLIVAIIAGVIIWKSNILNRYLQWLLQDKINLKIK